MVSYGDVACLGQGYLAALSASAYSFVSMVQRFGPIMNPGGAAISLTYLASEKIIPGATSCWQAVVDICTCGADPHLSD